MLKRVNDSNGSSSNKRKKEENVSKLLVLASIEIRKLGLARVVESDILLAQNPNNSEIDRNGEISDEIVLDSDLIRNKKDAENERLFQYERTIRNQIKADPELNGYFNRKFNQNLERRTEMRILKRWKEILRTDSPKTTDLPLETFRYILNIPYFPKYRSLLGIVETEGWMNQTSVFNDISNEISNPMQSDAIKFDNISKNVIDFSISEELYSITKKAEEEENIIKCDCCNSGSIIQCWENPNCQCYKVNQKLRELQDETDAENKRIISDFHTFNPMQFSDLDSWKTVGFACSESCSCKGKCTNNVTLIPEKGLFPLEVYRQNPTIGFGLRSLAAIPSGTVFMEYAGKFVNADGIRNKNDSNYSFEMFSIDPILDILKEIKECDSSFGEDLKKIWKQRWFINSSETGNVTRMICHSCDPNVGIVRIFQKGFSPAHCRLFLVSLNDIFSGVPLSLDYGEQFVKRAFKNRCLCKTVLCQNSTVIDKLKNCKDNELRMFFNVRQNMEFLRYKSILSIQQK